MRDSMCAEVNTCAICNKSFSTKQGLKTHTHTVHVLKLFDTSKKYDCVSCNRVFNSKDAYMQHCIAKHGACARPLEIADAPKKAIDGMKTLSNQYATFVNKRIQVRMKIIFQCLDLILLSKCSVCKYCGKKPFKDKRALSQHEGFCEIKQVNACRPVR